MIQRIQTLYLLVVALLTGATLLLQLRLCAVELVLLLGAVAMEAIYYYLSYRVFADMEFHTQGMRPAIALPAVCLLFGYLAARAILRDELLVRSLDRIR